MPNRRDDREIPAAVCQRWKDNARCQHRLRRSNGAATILPVLSINAAGILHICLLRLLALLVPCFWPLRLTRCPPCIGDFCFLFFLFYFILFYFILFYRVFILFYLWLISHRLILIPSSCSSLCWLIATPGPCCSSRCVAPLQHGCSCQLYRVSKLLTIHHGQSPEPTNQGSCWVALCCWRLSLLAGFAQVEQAPEPSTRPPLSKLVASAPIRIGPHLYGI